LTFESLKLGKRYAEGKLNVAVEFRRVGRVENYEAVFSRLPHGRSETYGAVNRALKGHLKPHGRHAYDRQAPVLFGPTEFVKAENKIIRSLIWLGRAQEGGELGAAPLYFSLFHLTFKGLFTIFDRQAKEVSLFSIETFSDRDRRIIERFSEVSSDPADVTAPIVGDRFSEDDPMEYAARLRIGVDDITIGVSTEKQADSPFEITDLSFGPF
jgi:hypothetical protein